MLTHDTDQMSPRVEDVLLTGGLAAERLVGEFKRGMGERGAVEWGEVFARLREEGLL